MSRNFVGRHDRVPSSGYKDDEESANARTRKPLLAPQGHVGNDTRANGRACATAAGAAA